MIPDRGSDRGPLQPQRSGGDATTRHESYARAGEPASILVWCAAGLSSRDLAGCGQPLRSSFESLRTNEAVFEETGVFRSC